MLEIARLRDGVDVNQLLASDIANYWMHFGLHQAPFEKTSQYAMYYPVAAWQKYLTTLHELTRSQHALTLVTGAVGGGKTMLAAQYLSQVDHQIHTHKAGAKPSFTVAELIDTLKAGFRASYQFGDTPLQDKLDQQLQEIQKRHYRCVLVVDDAHLFPIETIAALIHLSASQPLYNIHLYIVLLGEPQLKDRIDNLVGHSSHNVKIQAIELEALNAVATKNYVKHRLAKAGLTGGLPLTAEMLTRIYELSAGIPGRINRVAQQMLMDVLRSSQKAGMSIMNTQAESTGRAMDFLAAHRVKVISTLLLAAAGLVLWKFQAPQQQLPPTTNTVAVAPTQQPVTPAASPGVVKSDTPVVVHTQETAPASAPEQKTVQKAAQNSTPKVVAATLQPKMPTKTQTASVITPDEQTLLKMQGYTLQLLGVRTENKAKQFIAHSGLRRAYVFKTTFKDQPWYVVVAGDYATAMEAKAGVQALPEHIHPWVRPLSSVHKAINNA